MFDVVVAVDGSASSVPKRGRDSYPCRNTRFVAAGAEPPPVGGQALVGIPRVRSLRDEPALAAVSAVGPFEDASGAQVVDAEIWPSLWSHGDRHPVNDAAQVATVVERLARDDDDGLLHAGDDEEGWNLAA